MSAHGCRPNAGLPDWLAARDLDRFWRVARRRLEGNGLRAQGRLTMTIESRGERHAVAGLLGRAVTRDRVTVDLDALDDRLRERSGIGGLVEVAAAATAEPLLDRARQRRERAARRSEPLELARSLVDGPWVETWLTGLRSTGLLTGRDDAVDLVRQTARLLDAVLGGKGTAADRPALRSRVELAAREVGDAHALDEDRLLPQLLLRALAAVSCQPVPVTTANRRQLWESFGVMPDLVSSTCLTLGLRLRGDGSLAHRLEASADAGDPVHVTAWDVRREPSTASWQPSERAAAAGRAAYVLVCENPRVLEAVAQRFGGSITVVCTSGEPNTVVAAVLQSLREAGYRLCYHGDFDWPGIAIANRLVDRHGVEPWLMTTDDYRRGLHENSPRLSTRTVPPSWDAALGAAMTDAGRAVHEEAVLEGLLQQLPLG